jgi:hypothetical protein
VSRAPLAAAALLAVAAATSFAADPAEPKTMKASFIGEGGGYKPADKTTEGILVGDMPPAPNDAAPAPKAPEAPKPPRPSPAVPAPSAAPAPRAPASGVASLPGVSRPERAPVESPASPDSRSASPRTGAPSRSIAARPAATDRNAPVPGDAKPAGRQSLWNGLVQPLSMTGAAAADSNDPDAARENAERDYETHILGGKGEPARAALTARSAPAPAAASPASIASARSSGGKVFVSLAIDPREAGSLRDAVAGLGASAGFSADSRFEAMPGPNGTVLFSGWIPAGRLGDAMTRPGVKSLRVETHARPSNPAETSGEFLVGLRVDDAARARESVDAGVAALKSSAGFRMTRVVGLETAPDGRAVAIVSGFLPLSKLPRAMGLDEVAKIVPLGGEVPAPAAPVSEPGSAGVSGFAKFAVERGPWLIILTLLLLLPSLRAPAARAASVFNPYR